MRAKPPNKSKPQRAHSNQAKCPACTVMIAGDVDSLCRHFIDAHGRNPTEGERFQFRSFKKKDFRSSRYKVGFFKHPAEVSGGLPSLGKRR